MFTQNPLAVLKEFHSFYQNLYKDTHVSTHQDFEDFIFHLPLPNFSDSHKEILEGEITQAEVLFDIKQSKYAKGRGPNWVHSPVFALILTPHLANYFNTLRSGGSMDMDSNRAFISLFLVM